MQTQPISPANRRQEPRYRGRCKRLIWRKTDADPAPGVLFDISASGASFFVSQRRNNVPHTGEQIVLRRDTAAVAANQIYQVRRVEPLGHGYVLVGCCRALDVELLGDGVRLPRLSTRVDPHPRAWRSPRRGSIDANRSVAATLRIPPAADSSAPAPA
jgi:hypothetical protein